MDRMDLEDALAELVHDLGKYLRLPLAWLPADASPDDVHAAVRQALFATRRAGSTTTTAAEIWTAFTDEVGDNLTHLAGWSTLTQAISRAFAWGDRLNGPIAEPIDRAAVTADMSAVSPAIRALLDEVSRG